MNPEQLTETTELPLTAEEQLAKTRLELDILYLEYKVIVSERHDPYHYQNINARSREIAHKHAEYCRLRQQLLRSRATDN